jgi:thiol-disulfide isomerase/thioredoxin
LKEYPGSPQRADLERALVKAAIDLNDDQRLITYGENVLSRDPNNLQVLEHLTTALLHQGDKAHAERALEHARHFADLIQATYQNDKFEPGGGAAEVKRKDDYDRGRARALLLQARAHGLLGQNQEAIQLAQSSYVIFPSVEGAREAARWLSAAGQDAEAIQALADAFTIAGLRSADVEGGSDRTRMSELYRKLHGSEAGLGDLILKAYDSTSAQLAARRAELRQFDPNAQLKAPIQFTLSGLDGEKLQLSSLLGKVIVLDFWATWCVPCREQHPLYEAVKARFNASDEVVFLAVDADEDHSVVKPFLTQIKWTQKVYFDDGLQNLLQVTSIPTTIILDKKGELFTRMIGYLPDRFVEMLTDRVNDALGKPHVINQ